MDLLEFYHALFQRSCDAVNAMAGALHAFYTFRGYTLVDTQVHVTIAEQVASADLTVIT
jgi:hypothetical protein